MPLKWDYPNTICLLNILDIDIYTFSIVSSYMSIYMISIAMEDGKQILMH